MNTPTYKEQFDKITTAYINNELQPWQECACFIGNLLNGDSQWAAYRIYEPQGCSFTVPPAIPVFTLFLESRNVFYTPQEILDLENNFLGIMEEKGFNTDPTLVDEAHV